MPHACVTLPPGSSVIRSCPVTNAFGGQVIGSTARARLALRLGQRVSGEYLKPAVTLAGPERDLAAGPAEPGPGPAAGLPDQAGERMIEARAADRAGRPEVLRGAGHVLRRRGRYPAGVRGQPPGRGQGQFALVDDGRARGQVRVRPGAVGRGPGPRIPRGDADLQAAVGGQLVAGGQLQAERVAGPPEQPMAEQHPVRLVLDGLPAGPPGQAVDGVAVGRLAQVQLVVRAAEAVAPAVDAVRPGGQQLACPRGRQLGGLVSRDDRPSPVAQLAQAGAEFGDGGAVIASGDLVLPAGQRNRGRVSHGAHHLGRTAGGPALPPA